MHGQPGVGVELAGMPAKANLGRTAHICDPAARQNINQIAMVVILGAAGIGKGRAGPVLTWPAPASRRSYQIATRFVLMLVAEAAKSSENPPVSPFAKGGMVAVCSSGASRIHRRCTAAKKQRPKPLFTSDQKP